MTTATVAPARHADKIEAVIKELLREGQLHPWHRDAEVRHRAELRLKAHGADRHEIPSLTTWKRELRKLRILWRGPSGP